ncbi:MAG: hypothetical protein H6816_13665 [Phycisphaerales bacterium]|nr:hypothetical protein [Phycisphaerales bacterium]
MNCLIICLSCAVGTAWAADIDGDGVPDGADVCCNTPLGVAVDGAGRPLGDVDFDCDVDLADFAVFAANLTGPLAPVSCASCTDGNLNGSETDVDCGGGTCPACSNGFNCLAGSDCISTVCMAGVCQPPSCTDSLQNGSETDVDCGGGVCPPCAPGFGCLVGTDCTSFICSGATCQASSCSDGVQNGGETGVDCGGPCPACGLPLGASCLMDSACASSFCVDGVCCGSACSGVCQACDLSGSVGSCTLIPNGLDPDFECAGAATCNGTGGCTP